MLPGAASSNCHDVLLATNTVGVLSSNTSKSIEVMICLQKDGY
jgi:hypothetical protein